MKGNPYTTDIRIVQPRMAKTRDGFQLPVILGGGMLVQENIDHLRAPVKEVITDRSYAHPLTPDFYQSRFENFSTKNRGYLNPQQSQSQFPELDLQVRLAEAGLAQGGRPDLKTSYFNVPTKQGSIVARYSIEQSFPSNHGDMTSGYTPFIAEKIHVLREGDLEKVLEAEKSPFATGFHPCQFVISLRNGKVISLHNAQSPDKNIILYGIDTEGKSIFRVYEREKNAQGRECPFTGRYCSTQDYMWMGTNHIKGDIPENHRDIMEKAQRFADNIKKRVIEQGLIGKEVLINQAQAA